MQPPSRRPREAPVETSNLQDDLDLPLQHATIDPPCCAASRHTPTRILLLHMNPSTLTLCNVAVFALAATTAMAGDPPPHTCDHYEDVDINPHTPGLGHAGANSIEECCELCSSPEWWTKGCRFYTLSKGNCWFKADNSSVVPAPGKTSGHATSQVTPPTPPPWPPQGTTGDWIKIGPWNIGDDINGKGEAGTLADAVSPWGNPRVIYTGGRNNGVGNECGARPCWGPRDVGAHDLSEELCDGNLKLMI